MLLHAIMIILYGAEEYGVPADQIPGQVITLLAAGAVNVLVASVFVTPLHRGVSKLHVASSFTTTIDFDPRNSAFKGSHLDPNFSNLYGVLTPAAMVLSEVCNLIILDQYDTKGRLDSCGDASNILKAIRELLVS